MSFIIDEQWLKNKLNNQEKNIAIIDVRYQLGEEDAGKNAYLKSHIPGAYYLDLKKDLSGAVQRHGGNHPLPSIDELATKLGSLGIDQGTTVIIYDEGADMIAPRAWWLLNYMGHEKTYILDGGFKAWTEAENDVTSKIPKTEKSKIFKPTIRSNMIVNIENIKENIQRPSAILIDSRSRDRYLGKIEPLYTKAGHIPGAQNFFWKNVFNQDGTWKSEDQLKENFLPLSKEEEIIVSCGSGVSACANIVGLKLAGFSKVKLYPGSFSDWISYEENKLESKEK